MTRMENESFFLVCLDKIVWKFPQTDLLSLARIGRQVHAMNRYDPSRHQYAVQFLDQKRVMGEELIVGSAVSKISVLV